MIRLAILDHDNHELFVEDVHEDVVNSKYKGNCEDYIKDNYDVRNFSWEYVTEAFYLPMDFEYGCPVEIDFRNLID